MNNIINRFKVLLTMALLVTAIDSHAQYSSSKPYYYVYDSSRGSSIYKKGFSNNNYDMRREMYVVYFQGDWMVYEISDVNTVRSRNQTSDNNYTKRLRTSFNNFCDRYNNPPTRNDFALTQNNLPTYETLALVTTIEACKYEPNRSNSTKITYSEGNKYAYNYEISPFSMPKYWSGWQSSDLNFTFDDNGNTLIIWDNNTTANALYYKRIDPDSLNPNLNDL